MFEYITLLGWIARKRSVVDAVESYKCKCIHLWVFPAVLTNVWLCVHKGMETSGFLYEGRGGGYSGKTGVCLRKR